MNKKHLILITAVALLLCLSGCSISEELISLETPFSTNDGLFTAFLTYPLAQAINFISKSTNSVFWGITIVAVALNAIVLICTFKSNISMQKMTALQPEVQKIQLKYEGRDDQASRMRMSNEMQALYDKHGVNPIGSLISTFIQLPVLFAMYAAVRRSAAVAAGSFMGHSLATFPIDAFKNGEVVLIVLYLLMLVLQFFSLAVPNMLTNYHAKKEAELHHRPYEKQKNSNAIMSYGMLLLIGYIMLSWPTALSLYYCIYSIINIVKSFVIDWLTHRKG